MKTQSCRVIDAKECDILYQARYVRKCEHCDYEDTKEHNFTSIMKNGVTMDIDNWHCPKCGSLNLTQIIYNGDNK